MLKQRNFEQVYKKLNSAQKQAVDSIEGSVMVMAGPGTGKTQVLASRIANILRNQDIDPENILALTFTESASKNMRERVVEMIGTAGYYVNITTFHSFASDVIAQYPDKFPIDRGSQPLSDLERYEIFEKIIIETNLKFLKSLNSPLYYLKDIISQISNLKRENISPEKFENILKAEAETLEKEIEELPKSDRVKRVKSLEKQKELYLLYVKYEAELRLNFRFDFDDMISLVVEVFESDEEVLLDYQEKFQYILVDEYQDTNSAQNKIIDLLGQDQDNNPNIFVVGDPHQSIYRFQGASIENMLGFVQKYDQVKVITLETGYRCLQNSYDAAHSLISNNELKISFSGNSLDQVTDKTIQTSLSTRLKSFSTQRQGLKQDYLDSIKLFLAPDVVLENLFVVEEIKKLLKKGVSPNEIAVLYKNNTDIIDIAELLEKNNIPYELNTADNVFSDKYILQLLKLFAVIEKLKTNDEVDLIFDVMMFDWLNLDHTTVMKVAKIAARKRVNIIDILSKEWWQEAKFQELAKTYNLNEQEFNRLIEFKNKLYFWQKQNNNLLFSEWFSLIINKQEENEGFGYVNFLLNQPIKINHLLALNTLFSHIKQMLSQDNKLNLSKFLSSVAIMQDHNIVLKTKDLRISKGRVKLSTVHKAKGQEWEHVFIINCIDKKWGNKRKREMIPLPNSILSNTDISKKEKNEDDRRLFYVALTRAKKQVVISYPQVKISGDKTRELIGSMFIKEISDNTSLISDKITENLLVQSEELLAESLLEPVGKIDYSKLERDFFKKIVSEFKLSVTALNNYLKDKEEFIINSLLRVPRAKSPVLSFGTAIHYSLEQFYKKFQQSERIVGLDVLQNDFIVGLKRENLLDSDFKERKNRGLEVLEFYYSQIKNNLAKPLFIERFFGGNFNKLILIDGENEIKLSGRIDRVDLIDAKKREVRIIDYKTGKPKTEGYIEGSSYIKDYSQRELNLPESIRGRYKRQLVFYKLLAQLDKSFDYNIVQTIFDFVEPSESNSGTLKHIERQFTISDEAVEDLKNLIKEVMREIRDLKFLD